MATSSTSIKKFNRVLSRPEFYLLLAPFILLAPVWLTGKAMFWGTPSTQFVPWWVEASRQLLGGQLPLWNPSSGMGAPLLANYQSALIYPPNWLYFLLYQLGGTSFLAWGMAPLVAAHLAWAGLGMARLGRVLGLGAFAQAICGLAYGLCAYLVARSAFLSIVSAAAWLPWILYGVIVLLGIRPGEPQSQLETPGTTHSHYRFFGRSSGVVFLAVLVSAQLLAGHAQTTWYSLLFAFIWGAFWAAIMTKSSGSLFSSKILVGARALVRWIGKAWFLLAAAVLLGAALAAIQLLPTTEYLLESQRAGAVEYEFAMTYSFWPWRFLTLLAPNVFGSPANGDYWGYANYWEDAVYIGFLPFILALLALFTRGRKLPGVDSRFPRLVGFLFAVILAAFLLALGKNTPVFPWLYRHLPTFDMFQAPTRISLLAVFCLALLAGIGAESWHRPVGRGLYWVRLGTAAALAATIGAGLAAFVAREYLGDVEPSTIRSFALLGFWGVGAGILTLNAPPEPDSPAPRSLSSLWTWAAVGWVALDLIIAGWGLNPGIDLDFYRLSSPSAGEIKQAAGDGRLFLPKDEEQKLKFEHFFRFKGYELAPQASWIELRAALLPNINLLDQIASANNFDPLVPGRYARWMLALESADEATRQHLLNLMSVKVVEWVQASEKFGIRFEPRHAYAPARWSGCVEVAASSAEALNRVLHRDPVSPDPTILETEEGSVQPPCNRGAEAGIQILQNLPTRLTVRVQAPAVGYLVSAQVLYPGWQAFLDGKQTHLYSADYLFRAVQVPAGEHNVTFLLFPIVFYTGALISLFAWLVVGVYTLRRILGRG